MEKYVIAPEQCSRWFTPGEKYKIERFGKDKNEFWLTDDDGDTVLCLRANCNFANGNWIFPKTNIGEVIKSYRQQKQMTQDALFAVAFPDSDNPSGRAYISKIESGKQNPSLNSFLAIAKALDVPASQILQEAGL